VAELSEAELDGLISYWEAANYLTVAQIHLQYNALLRAPLRAEHIKPRLLGHWGTSPGLNLVYAQLNRLIAASPSTSTSTASGPASPRWRRRWAASMPSSSPAASARTRRGSERRLRPQWSSWASPSIPP
jgi:hypothetical protein